MQPSNPIPGSLPPGNQPAAPPETDLTGQMLGDFQILRRLGQGGMGQVYLAKQISLNRNVAFKLLKPELAANEVALRRFKAEAEAVARVTHANIVQVYASGDVLGIHYMALEYVEGRNLREFLEKKGPPDLAFGLAIMRQVAAALQRAGELGIIHRDIKPENILLTRKEEVKVADFGLSRVFEGSGGQPLNLTQSGVAMGTPLYMSPEQVEGRPVDPRTDIYSFGVTCYHIFAGHPPFRGTTPFEVALQHVQKEPQPLAEIRPDLPADLCAIIHKMMAKKPEDRFQTGREIVRELARLRDALVGLTTMGSGSGVNQLPAARLADSAVGLSNARIALPPRSPWKWIAVVSLLLAFAFGLAVGYVFIAAMTPHDPHGNGKAAEDAAAKALLEKKDREEYLRKVVEEHIHLKNPPEVAMGMKYSAELGGMLLKDRARLDDADAFFKELAAPGRANSYRFLGKLGKGMVLAFKDEAAESNKILVQALDRDKPDKGPGKIANFWRDNPAFAELLADAIRHNMVNLGLEGKNRKEVPVEWLPLDRYRRPPPPVIKGAPAMP